MNNLMSIEDLILTALQLRACYVGFKADLKARHECHGFSRWYKSSLHFGSRLVNFQFNSMMLSVLFWGWFVI